MFVFNYSRSACFRLAVDIRAELVPNMNLSNYEKEIAQLRADLAATQEDLKRREKQLLRETDQKLAIQAKHIEQLLQSRFALRIKSVHLKYDITTWDGDFNVTRTYEGLQTGEGLQLLFFTHKAVTSTPDAKFGQARLLGEKSSPGVSMDFWEERNTKFFRVKFPPDLTSSATGADYAFEYEMKKGVLMTKDAALDAYRNDPRPNEAIYHVNEISTGILQLDVLFPAKYPAKCNCLALVGDITHAEETQSIVHVEETKRLKIQSLERGVSVLIEKPLPGFQYLVEWEAPSEQDFAKLKAEVLGRELASNKP